MRVSKGRLAAPRAALDAHAVSSHAPPNAINTFPSTSALSQPWPAPGAVAAALSAVADALALPPHPARAAVTSTALRQGGVLAEVEAAGGLGPALGRALWAVVVSGAGDGDGALAALAAAWRAAPLGHAWLPSDADLVTALWAAGVSDQGLGGSYVGGAGSIGAPPSPSPQPLPALTPSPPSLLLLRPSARPSTVAAARLPCLRRLLVAAAAVCERRAVDGPSAPGTTGILWRVVAAAHALLLDPAGKALQREATAACAAAS